MAHAGGRPNNATPNALQEAQAKLPSANLSQLSQLFSGLVKMGVKPAASWLDSMQELSSLFLPSAAWCSCA
jgi:hypothetical protein